MTARQREVFDWIESFINERHYAPTIREIADAMDIVSNNGVVCTLTSLQRKGWIDRDPLASRAMWITD